MVALIIDEHQSTMTMDGAVQVAISAALFVDTLLLRVLLQD